MEKINFDNAELNKINEPWFIDEWLTNPCNGAKKIKEIGVYNKVGVNCEGTRLCDLVKVDLYQTTKGLMIRVTDLRNSQHKSEYFVNNTYTPILEKLSEDEMNLNHSGINCEVSSQKEIDMSGASLKDYQNSYHNL